MNFIEKGQVAEVMSLDPKSKKWGKKVQDIFCTNSVRSKELGIYPDFSEAIRKIAKLKHEFKNMVKVSQRESNHEIQSISARVGMTEYCFIKLDDGTVQEIMLIF